MQIDVVRTSQGFNLLADEWNHLLEKSASDVPFLRHEYLRAWWQTLGGGEWPSGELFVITGRDGGELVAAAPLFFTQDSTGSPILALLGSVEISDYLDFLGRAGDLPLFIDGLFQTLDGAAAPAWETLELSNLPEGTPTLALVQEAAGRCGWHYSEERLQPCPSIPLPGDWEAYLAGIDKKQRHEVRRKMRRAENYEQPVRWYIVEEAAAFDQELEDFLQLMEFEPEKRQFLTDAMREQMRLAMRAAFEAGWLQLSFLEVGERKAAGYLNFDYNGRIWVYNSGMNPEYRDLSPGWVLLGRLLQWANENGRKEFDFMRGSEDYKYRFGGVDRYVVRATVKRGG